MQPKAINPYSSSEDKTKEALDFIIANLPASPTFNQLNEVLLTAIFGSNPDSPPNSDTLAPFIYSVLPLSYNGYVNNETAIYSSQLAVNSQYNENQLIIINKLLKGINRLPLEATGDFLSSMDEVIAQSSLNTQEQLPLYFAVRIAQSQHTYWSDQISTPGLWAAYLNADNAINYLHAPSWVSAGAQGALLSYGLIKPAQAIFPDLFSSIIGGVGLPVGKVVFGWVGCSSPFEGGR